MFFNLRLLVLLWWSSLKQTNTSTVQLDIKQTTKFVWKRQDLKRISMWEAKIKERRDSQERWIEMTNLKRGKNEFWILLWYLHIKLQLFTHEVLWSYYTGITRCCSILKIISVLQYFLIYIHQSLRSYWLALNMMFLD